MKIKNLSRTVLLSLGGIAAAAPLLVACGDSLNYGRYYSGMVYDGAVGGRLTDYTITMQYFNRTVEGKVDEDGRYFIGPLEEMNDFTVEIVADGYRSFLSHNALVPTDGQSNYYDAYLFPEDIPVPDAEIHVTLANSDELVSGTARLQPTAASLLYDDPTETPAGIPGQLWENDDDLQFRTVTVTFEDGVIQVPGDELVYGVNYALTVFGVDGYQPETGGFQAGVDGMVGVVLQELNKDTLALAFNSTTLGPISSGEVVLAFNVPIEFDPPEADGLFEEHVDASLAISPIDGDGDGTLNTLVPDASADDTERGTSVSIDGNQLILRWSPGTALETSDDDDPVQQVTYGGLDLVRIRPVGGDSTDAMTVGALLGSASITVDLEAQL